MLAFMVTTTLCFGQEPASKSSQMVTQDLSRYLDIAEQEQFEEILTARRTVYVGPEAARPSFRLAMKLSDEFSIKIVLLMDGDFRQKLSLTARKVVTPGGEKEFRKSAVLLRTETGESYQIEIADWDTNAVTIQHRRFANDQVQNDDQNLYYLD